MMAHRRLDVDGINNTGTKLIDRGRAREAEHYECSWHEACAATDTVLEHFGDPHRDRGSHPVRDWAIYDLAIAKSMDRESTKTTYNRHLKRLYEIFVFRSPTIYGGT